jgi:peptide/nickel transport system substrate-binding protein
MLIFDSLVRKDAGYQLRPWLAESWENPDPRTWIFHLHPGVRFQDGRPLGCPDVKWTLDSMRNGTILTSRAGAYRSVARVDAVDALTCVIRLKRPDPFLLWNLSDGAIGIVPTGSGRDFWRHPVGSGPYRFVSEEQDKEVVLERSQQGWQRSARIPRIVFKVVPDDITRALELQKGSADAELNALEPDTIQALRSDPRLRVESAPGTIVNYINLNLRDPFLRDARVREAVACAIDRRLILDTLWRGGGRIADDLLPPGHWARPASVTPIRYDPARADALLDAAGLRRGPDGIRLHLQMKISNTSAPTRLMALVVQQQLRAVGIAMDLSISEFGTFYADVTRGAFSMYALRWIGGNESPDIFGFAYSAAKVPPHGANRGYYINPELDRLMDDAADSGDPARARADYGRVQQILARDLPTIPLWYQDNILVHTQRLQNVHLDVSGNYDFLNTATLAP